MAVLIFSAIFMSSKNLRSLSQNLQKKPKTIYFSIAAVVISTGLILAVLSNLFIQAAQITNLTTITSSYIGGSGNDEANAVEIQSDKNVIIGGKVTGIPTGVTPTVFLNGTTGGIARISPNGSYSVTVLGSVVDDLDINRTDNTIYAVGDFGLAALSANGTSLLWSKTFPGTNAGGGALYSSGRRIAVGLNGTVGVIFNKTAYLYDSAGTQIGSAINLDTKPYLGGDLTRYAEDIAVDSINNQIVIAGWSQVNSTFQSAVLLAISYNTSTFGTTNWQNYAWFYSAAQTSSSTADTRGKRVSLGRDGKIYFTGKADGGNSIFRYNPKCLVTGGSACRGSETSTAVNNVNIDTWNNGAGFSSGDVGYFAKYNPSDGAEIAGQFQYTNAGVNAARSYAILPVTADEDGNVYQGGQAVNGTIPNRTTLQINSNPTSSRVNNETALIGVNPSFNERTVTATWTAATGAGTGEIRAISAAQGIVAVVGNTDGNIVTFNATQSAPNGLTEGFFSVWQPSVSSATGTSTSTSTSGSATSGTSTSTTSGSSTSTSSSSSSSNTSSSTTSTSSITSGTSTSTSTSGSASSTSGTSTTSGSSSTSSGSSSSSSSTPTTTPGSAVISGNAGDTQTVTSPLTDVSKIEFTLNDNLNNQTINYNLISNNGSCTGDLPGTRRLGVAFSYSFDKSKIRNIKVTFKLPAGRKNVKVYSCSSPAVETSVQSLGNNIYSATIPAANTYVVTADTDIVQNAVGTIRSGGNPVMYALIALALVIFARVGYTVYKSGLKLSKSKVIKK